MQAPFGVSYWTFGLSISVTFISSCDAMQAPFGVSYWTFGLDILVIYTSSCDTIQALFGVSYWTFGLVIAVTYIGSCDTMQAPLGVSYWTFGHYLGMAAIHDLYQLSLRPCWLPSDVSYCLLKEWLLLQGKLDHGVNYVGLDYILSIWEILQSEHQYQYMVYSDKAE